jgi:hypothetical protein
MVMAIRQLLHLFLFIMLENNLEEIRNTNYKESTSSEQNSQKGALKELGFNE